MFFISFVLILINPIPATAIPPSKIIQNLKFDEITQDLVNRFEKPIPKNIDTDTRNAFDTLNTTIRQFNEFQSRDDYTDSRDSMINGRIGVLLFTRFCGPGARLLNKIFKTDERTYADIDVCCRMHDECPHYVSDSDDYKQYPGLEQRPQFFSR